MEPGGGGVKSRKKFFRKLFIAAILFAVLNAIYAHFGIFPGNARPYVIQKIEPLFVTLVKWQDVSLVAGLTLVMIVLAAYIPLRRMMKIDPAIVFKT